MLVPLPPRRSQRAKSRPGSIEIAHACRERRAREIIMRKVVVAGVGQTAFGKFKDRSVRSLAEEALQQALKDACIDASRIGNACRVMLAGSR